MFPVVWAPGVPGETAKSKAFAENYQKKYNVQVEQFAAVSYDSFWLLADAIKRAGKAERGAIQQALLSTKDFNGVLGAKMNFDQDRQMSGEPVLMTWKAGKQVPFVKPD